jgi:hypothetical protein
MPSTGLAAFTLTRDQLITMVMQGPLRVLLSGAAPGANDVTACALELNMMLKTWFSTGLKLWTYQQIQIPMVANQATYTLGPVGANVTCVRPLRVFEFGNFIRQIINGIPNDVPLNLLSRTDYDQFGSKQAMGVPNSIYYFPGIDVAGGATSPSTGYGTLYVYTTAAAGALPRTVFINAQRPLYDMNAAGDEFDVPSEWLEAIKWGLAARMSDYFEVPEDRIQRIYTLAEKYLQDASGTSTEEAPFRVIPNRMGGGRRRR